MNLLHLWLVTHLWVHLFAAKGVKIKTGVSTHSLFQSVSPYQPYDGIKHPFLPVSAVSNFNLANCILHAIKLDIIHKTKSQTYIWWNEAWILKAENRYIQKQKKASLSISSCCLWFWNVWLESLIHWSFAPAILIFKRTFKTSVWVGEYVITRFSANPQLAFATCILAEDPGPSAGPTYTDKLLS